MTNRMKMLSILGLVWLSAVPAWAQLEDNGNGTITDCFSGLMWLKNANPAGAAMTWDQALTWAANLDFAGHQD